MIYWVQMVINFRRLTENIDLDAIKGRFSGGFLNPWHVYLKKPTQLNKSNS